MLNIALDYDNTYTTNPDFWRGFIEDANNYNYRVMIVTFRDERFDMTDELKFLIEHDVPVYFTRGVSKKWWMAQFALNDHKQVNIWIDDKPETILHNSELDFAGLEEWRNAQAA